LSVDFDIPVLGFEKKFHPKNSVENIKEENDES